MVSTTKSICKFISSSCLYHLTSHCQHPIPSEPTWSFSTPATVIAADPSELQIQVEVSCDSCKSDSGSVHPGMSCLKSIPEDPWNCQGLHETCQGILVEVRGLSHFLHEHVNSLANPMVEVTMTMMARTRS